MPVVRKGKPRRITVAFQAPHAGTFCTSLKIVFNDKTQQGDKQFVVLRELRGNATLPSSAASAASEGHGITVSHDEGLEFSLERARSEPFETQTLELFINKSSSDPSVSFEGVKVRSQDGSMAR